MIRRIINSRSKTIIFSAGLVGFSVGISAVLGLLRDRLLVSRFSVAELDPYFAAFAIPDFIYGLVIAGGIVAAFLPIFAQTFEKDKNEGWRLSSNTLSILFIILSSLCAVLFVLAPLLIKIIVPGFTLQEVEITVSLTRIMLISPILLGLSSLFSGVLQYFERFVAYSLAPIFYNIGIIIGIIFLTPHFWIFGVAYGVVIGSLLHLLVQIPVALKTGFSYKLTLDFKQKEVRNIFYLLLPRIVGQAASKINVLVIVFLASSLAGPGNISIFNFSNHLQSFPIRIIGVAFAVAAFPAFSKSMACKNTEKFLKSFARVICQVLFLIIPASIIMFLLRAQIVRLVLGTDLYGWRETQLTAASLGIFAFSFFAAALVQILVRAFFSFQDTKTPVIASLVAMGSSIALSFFFVWLFSFENFFSQTAIDLLKLQGIRNIKVIAFPTAIVISTILHFLMLIYLLKSKVGDFKNLGIRKCLYKTLLSSLVMGSFTFATLRLIGSIITLDTFVAVLTQTTAALTVATITYIVVARIIKTRELFEIKEALLNR